MGKKDHLSFTQPGDSFIRFYDQRFKESYFLSNFYPCQMSIEVDASKPVVNFYCSEGLYHARRAPGFPWEQFHALSGKQAWALAQTLKKEQSFSPEKYEIMLEVVRQKFEAEDLKEKLLSTKEAYLVERTKDEYWGDGLNGKGENLLGKICMIVREEIGGEGEVEKPEQYLDFLQRFPKKA
jgi:ribA/ribD-fused uncharacterized protein